METIKFKTNINCGGCVAKATPFLNKAAGEGHWEVDTADAQKILTVTGTGEKNIVKALKKAGFNAERL